MVEGSEDRPLCWLTFGLSFQPLLFFPIQFVTRLAALLTDSVTSHSVYISQKRCEYSSTKPIFSISQPCPSYFLTFSIPFNLRYKGRCSRRYSNDFNLNKSLFRSISNSLQSQQRSIRSFKEGQILNSCLSFKSQRIPIFVPTCFKAVTIELSKEKRQGEREKGG